MSKPLVIFGSVRTDGNTNDAVEAVFGEHEIDRVNLCEMDISHYDYDHANSDDDFLPLAERMTKAETIVLVTPVYWYSMSAHMKIFFDRISDLITIAKPLGRALAGRKVYLIACGSSPELPAHFEEPFSATCNYLAMDYRGTFYYDAGENHEQNTQNKQDAAAFGREIVG